MVGACVHFRGRGVLGEDGRPGDKAASPAAALLQKSSTLALTN
jgi:hypothetical protein